MAKVNHILSDIRGKLGGVVYARNAFGAYVRTKVTPVNPSTNRQADVRMFLGTLASDWGQNLTPAERAAWTAYAQQTPLTDVFGNQKILSGAQMFVRTNVIALDASVARIDAAPVVFGEAPFVVKEADGDPASTIILESSTSADDPNTLNTTDLDAATLSTWVGGDSNQILQVQTSPKLSPSIQFYQGPWSNAITFAVGNGTLNAISIPITQTLSAGDVIFARFRFVDTIGRVSPAITRRYTAVTLAI